MSNTPGPKIVAHPTYTDSSYIQHRTFHCKPYALNHVFALHLLHTSNTTTTTTTINLFPQVYMFYITLISGVPVYSIIVRYNLLQVRASCTQQSYM